MLRVSMIGLAASQVAGFSVGAGAMRTVSRSSDVQMASLYDFEAVTIDGKKAPMSAYKGKPVLILNVASL